MKDPTRLTTANLDSLWFALKLATRDDRDRYQDRLLELGGGYFCAIIAAHAGQYGALRLAILNASDHLRVWAWKTLGIFDVIPRVRPNVRGTQVMGSPS